MNFYLRWAVSCVGLILGTLAMLGFHVLSYDLGFWFSDSLYGVWGFNALFVALYGITIAKYWGEFE